MMRLHDYWRSTASYRVRIGLNLKGLDHARTTHDLRQGAQDAQTYRALNPQGLVPALEVGDRTFAQSLAILEWLDERHPEPPLLPLDPDGRAIVRTMAQTIACDIHPLNNLRVLNTLRGDLGADDGQIRTWIARWIEQGFSALEVLVTWHGGRFAFGDAPSLADCCLTPQIYSAERFGVDLSGFPRLVAAGAAARALPQVAAAHPDWQPDADPR